MSLLVGEVWKIIVYKVGSNSFILQKIKINPVFLKAVLLRNEVQWACPCQNTLRLGSYKKTECYLLFPEVVPVISNRSSIITGLLNALESMCFRFFIVI